LKGMPKMFKVMGFPLQLFINWTIYILFIVLCVLYFVILKTTLKSKWSELQESRH
jgi:hypothetical protein